MIKSKHLKAAREKRQVYALKIKNMSHSSFFMENGASEKRMKNNIFKVLKGNVLNPSVLYPGKIPLKVKMTDRLSDTQSLRYFTPSTLKLQEILKDVFQVEQNDNRWKFVSIQRNKECWK